MSVIDVIKKYKDHGADVEDNLNQLYLNEELLVAMFSGTSQCAFIKSKIDVFHKCHQID